MIKHFIRDSNNMSYRTKAIVPIEETELEHRDRTERYMRRLRIKKELKLMAMRGAVPMIAPIIIGLVWNTVNLPVAIGMIVASITMMFSMFNFVENLER